jgi:hypothetical protein
LKLENAVFYWKPRTSEFQALTTESVPISGMTTGAVFDFWKTASNEVRVQVALADALAAICRDGVAPSAVAKAIMAVDELRYVLPVDFATGESGDIGATLPPRRER